MSTFQNHTNALLTRGNIIRIYFVWQDKMKMREKCLIKRYTCCEVLEVLVRFTAWNTCRTLLLLNEAAFRGCESLISRAWVQAAGFQWCAWVCSKTNLDPWGKKNLKIFTNKLEQRNHEMSIRNESYQRLWRDWLNAIDTCSVDAPSSRANVCEFSFVISGSRSNNSIWHHTEKTCRALVTSTRLQNKYESSLDGLKRTSDLTVSPRSAWSDPGQCCAANTRNLRSDVWRHHCWTELN